jgi:hypothetical protein
MWCLYIPYLEDEEIGGKVWAQFKQKSFISSISWSAYSVQSYQVLEMH